MKKIIIFLSGIYLAVFGAFQLVRFWPRYDFVLDQAPGLYRMFLAVNFGIFSVSGLACVITGLGLIYRKIWAKNLLIVVSSFALLFGITIAVCMACLYFMLPYGKIAVSEMRDLYYWAYVIICLIVMPACFLIFFSREKGI